MAHLAGAQRPLRVRVSLGTARGSTIGTHSHACRLSGLRGLGLTGGHAEVSLAVMSMLPGAYATAGGALSTAACPAQKSVTRAASSVGHSSEGRAHDPVRTAERASFIAAV